MSNPSQEAPPSIDPSKTWYGQHPPPELMNSASSLELLSQGAEARVWLVTLSATAADVADDCSATLNSTTTTPAKDSNDDKNKNSNNNGNTKNKHAGTIHVGSGIHVPKLLKLSQSPSPLKSAHPSSAPVQVICKERFPKKYRHPQLDLSLTKTRTKAEARCLIRCQRGGIPCPTVFAIAHWSSNDTTNDTAITDADDGAVANGSGDSGTSKDEKESITSQSKNVMHETSTIAACLFLEYINGCTVRQYLERLSTTQTETTEMAEEMNAERDEAAQEEGEPTTKRPRCELSTDVSSSTTTTQQQQQQQERHTTLIDKQTLRVAHALGTLVGKMHAAGVVHGDLTTSNVMIRNPPWMVVDSGNDNDNNEEVLREQPPQLALIDFGLATSTSSTLTNNTSNSNSNSNKKKQQRQQQQSQKQHKQHHHAEEKAVDLYVLERAFLSTHPESEPLVEEVWKGYREYFEGLDKAVEAADGDDDDNVDNDAAQDKDESNEGSSSNVGVHGHVAKAVLNRLEQVRMRGRKRECFG